MAWKPPKSSSISHFAMKLLFPLLGGAVLLTVALAQNTAPAPVPSGIRKLELPPETGTYRNAPGVELAQAFCLNCHSTEYTEYQPPLPATYWQGTVKKMKEKFGAILPDEVIAPLTQYLVDAYGKKP
jgi:hypothetical protein